MRLLTGGTLNFSLTLSPLASMLSFASLLSRPSLSNSSFVDFGVGSPFDGSQLTTLNELDHRIGWSDIVRTVIRLPQILERFSHGVSGGGGSETREAFAFVRPSFPFLVATTESTLLLLDLPIALAAALNRTVFCSVPAIDSLEKCIRRRSTLISLSYS